MTTFCQPGSPNQETQDRVCALQLDDGTTLCVLSDGVGTGRDPGRCADRVVKLIADGFSARPSHWSIGKVLGQLVEVINESLYREGAYLDGTASMLATLSVVVIAENKLYGLNVGDSPIYRYHQSKLQLLSKTQAEKNADGEWMLSQAMGMGPRLQPHQFQYEVEKGDLILLASDGVNELFGSEEVMESALKKAATARTIILNALDYSKESETDDLSAILIEVQELDRSPGSSSKEKPIPSPKLNQQIEAIP